MATLMITVGLPGCGKFDWSLSWVDADPQNRVRVARDDLRNMTHGRCYGARWQENDITTIRNGIITRMLKCGRDVVVDDTNLRWRHIATLMEIARRENAIFRVKSFLDVPLDQCMAQFDFSDPEDVTPDRVRHMWRNSLTEMIDNSRTAIMEEFDVDDELINDAMGEPNNPDYSDITDFALKLFKDKLNQINSELNLGIARQLRGTR